MHFQRKVADPKGKHYDSVADPRNNRHTIVEYLVDQVEMLREQQDEIRANPDRVHAYLVSNDCMYFTHADSGRII